MRLHLAEPVGRNRLRLQILKSRGDGRLDVRDALGLLDARDDLEQVGVAMVRRAADQKVDLLLHDHQLLVQRRRFGEQEL